MGKIKRPEYSLSADLFYNDKESLKYTNNSRMIHVQYEMTMRALELLAIPKNQGYLILDIGCGSGLSGECISESDNQWIGIDISLSMLNIAKERDQNSQLILGDIGSGLPFKPGSFDAAISISALQWICYSNTKNQLAHKQLYTFFVSLYSLLKRNAKAVFQIYPENDAQLNLITRQALKAGFNGGVVVDFPQSTKAKKIYLYLCAGTFNYVNLPKPKTIQDRHNKFGTKWLAQNHSKNGNELKGVNNDEELEINENTSSNSENDIPIEMEEKEEDEIDDEPETVHVSSKSKCILSNKRKLKGGKKKIKKDKSWIMNKKEIWKKRGKNVTRDSKYSGRKRKMRF